jgi:hypothetical protein
VLPIAIINNNPKIKQFYQKKYDFPFNTRKYFSSKIGAINNPLFQPEMNSKIKF